MIDQPSETFGAETSRVWLMLRSAIWVAAPLWLCVELVLMAGWWSLPWLAIPFALSVASAIAGAVEWKTQSGPTSSTGPEQDSHLSS